MYSKWTEPRKHQEKILLSDENVGILRALYALISAYNHLSELQNEVTATSKSDNHISANICADSKVFHDVIPGRNLRKSTELIG